MFELVALLACVAFEIAFLRGDERKPSRLPGAIFLLLLPIGAALISLPLRSLWQSLGVGPALSLSDLPVTVQFVALILVLDFFRYWEHRIQHRWWWPVHSVHHSPTELHAANSYGHPLQAVTDFLFIAIPFSLIGSDVRLPVAVALVTTFLAVFIHSPIKLHFGPLRHILVDNRYHRIHHSMEPRHFDKNFGIVFSLWDQMFGTAHFPARDEWPACGVMGVAPPKSFMAMMAMPLRFFPSQTPVKTDHRAINESVS